MLAACVLQQMSMQQGVKHLSLLSQDGCRLSDDHTLTAQEHREKVESLLSAQESLGGHDVIECFTFMSL